MSRQSNIPFKHCSIYMHFSVRSHVPYIFWGISHQYMTLKEHCGGHWWMFRAFVNISNTGLNEAMAMQLPKHPCLQDVDM